MNKKILYFTATWCGPCKTFGPIMESLKGEINFEKIDIDEDRQRATDYGVRAIPTLLLLEDNKVKDNMSGVHSAEQIRQWYNG